MFLNRKKTGKYRYLYLCQYVSDEVVYQGKEYVYSFGRIESAFQKMKSWEKDFSGFPKELIDLGCKWEDLKSWIRTIETGVTKTGKKFKCEKCLRECIAG